jgi:ribosomal protein L24
MIPLRSRIAALPGLWPTALFGSSAAVTFAIVFIFGPVSGLGYLGYLPAALVGAFFGVIGTLITLGPISAAISEANGDPFHKGDTVQVLNGRYKGAQGKVENTSGYHDGAYVTVNVAGESKVYGTLDIFLIERLSKPEEKTRSENIAEPGNQEKRISGDLKAKQVNLKKKLKNKHKGQEISRDFKDESTITMILSVTSIFTLISLCFVAPWWVYFLYGPWFGIGVAVFIFVVNILGPVLLNVNKFIGGTLLLNALVVIVVSIMRLIG